MYSIKSSLCLYCNYWTNSQFPNDTFFMVVYFTRVIDLHFVEEKKKKKIKLFPFYWHFRDGFRFYKVWPIGNWFDFFIVIVENIQVKFLNPHKCVYF